jgi:short subunit fatty acids transporter
MALDQQDTPRAVLTGAVAALLGGALWAIIVAATKYEVGWVAWGVGGLVGFAMARATARRDATIAAMAAALSVGGLIAGKFLIIQFATAPAVAKEIRDNPVLMTQAILHDLGTRRAFPDHVQSRLDGMTPEDTLSDALWDDLNAAATDYATAMDDAEGKRVSLQYANLVQDQIPLSEQLKSQFSLWDLLWFVLALTTAWRMMSGRGASVAEEHRQPEEMPPA